LGVLGVLGEEKVLWRGRPTVLAFTNMLAGGTLLIVLSSMVAFLVPLPSIRYFSLAGLTVGAFIMVLALFLSQAYAYTVTSAKLRKEYCFVASSIEEVPLREVTNIVVVQDAVGRLLGFGTVRADTSGTAYGGIVFKGVKNPHEIFKAIADARNTAEKPVENPYNVMHVRGESYGSVEKCLNL